MKVAGIPVSMCPIHILPFAGSPDVFPAGNYLYQ